LKNPCEPQANKIPESIAQKSVKLGYHPYGTIIKV